MTRQPIGLLDLLIRVNAAAQTPGDEHEDLAEQFTQVMADPATGEQLRALRTQAQADVAAERDSLLSGLQKAVQVWTQKRDSNRRDGDRRAGIIYDAVVQRALDILNDQETDESAQAQAGSEG